MPDDDDIGGPEMTGEASSGAGEASAVEAIPDPAATDEIEVEPDDRAEFEQRLAAEHERLLRTAAELDNVRKRARRDVEDAQVRGRAEVLGELLPALDSIDLALSSATPTTDTGSLIQGMELVRRQFLSGMERFGLKPINAAGQIFDPALHEAVAQRPSEEVGAGGVLQDMRRGYLLGERLLRASMVVVSTGSGPEENGPSVEE
ncbi:MAG TPA: nucleotide exchange factor GrpE [Polyangia bacterium]|nr:nucleotide exchange factor GrpE [Polyangia bacterium]